METLKNMTPLQWLIILMSFNSAVVGATAQLNDLFGAAIAHYIVSGVTFANTLLGAFMVPFGGQSAMVKNVLAMPGVEKLMVNGNANTTLATIAVDPNIDKITAKPEDLVKVSKTAGVVGALLILVMSTALLLPGPAMAQSRRTALPPTTTDTETDTAADQKCALIWDPLHFCGKLTGNVETDLKRVADRIRQVKKDDLSYAILKATKAGTPTAKVRLQCMTAVQDAAAAWDGDQIKDASGAVIPRPDPALITSIEDTAELVDALSPQGALFSSCAGAAQMFAVSTLQVINAIVTGAALIIPKA